MFAEVASRVARLESARSRPGSRLATKPPNPFVQTPQAKMRPKAKALLLRGKTGDRRREVTPKEQNANTYKNCEYEQQATTLIGTQTRK